MFPSITRFSNLYEAFIKARAGKRHKPDVAAFECHLERELLQLRRELEASTYRPGPYRAFLIHDPKERMISAAPFRDRVVHHALCNVIEPILDKTLTKDFGNTQD